MMERCMSRAVSRAPASAGASTRMLVICILGIVRGRVDGYEIELCDAAERLEMALVAGMRAWVDGSLARQEFFGEPFERAGPLVPHGIGIRIGDEYSL